MEKKPTFSNKGRDQNPAQRAAAIRNWNHLRLTHCIQTLYYTCNKGWISDKELETAMNIVASAISRIKNHPKLPRKKK